MENSIYVVSIVDTSNNEIPIADWTKNLQTKMKFFTFAEVKEEANGGCEEGDENCEHEEPKTYTEKEVKKYWDSIKKLPKESLLYYSVDLKKPDGEEKSKWDGLVEQLVRPYYAGPENRMVPSLFVLRGEGAFIITGPNPMDALKVEMPAILDGTAFKKVK